MSGGPAAGPTLRTMPANAQQTPPAPWNSAYGPLRPNQVMVETTTAGATLAKLATP